MGCVYLSENAVTTVNHEMLVHHWFSLLFSLSSSRPLFWKFLLVKYCLYQYKCCFLIIKCNVDVDSFALSAEGVL